MNIEYIISHGKNGCTTTYEEISVLSELVIKKYHFSAPEFWMWKMFQLGFAYGKHETRVRRKGGAHVSEA